MSDEAPESAPSRGHRGPHPDDATLFAPALWPLLRDAAADLAWLLERGYTMNASVMLVGNHRQLTQRQRLALMRAVCSDASLASRRARALRSHETVGRELIVDGFNVLMTIEAALAGGTLLLGRDGNVRNLAPLHGSYRVVAETTRAITLVGEHLAALGVAHALWLLDAPVSNSGRLKTALGEAAAAHGWPWSIALEPRVDGRLRASERVVVSSDAIVLDGCGAWLDVASPIVRALPGIALVDAFGASARPDARRA